MNQPYQHSYFKIIKVPPGLLYEMSKGDKLI